MTAAEQRRVAALHAYQLLDRPPGPELEALVRVAAAVADVPTVALNLIDSDRQCQLTTVGFEGRDSARVDSMCARHFEAGEVVHLPDASRLPAYANNPWVDGRFAKVRFYLSIPLVNSDGFALGTLCVFDEVERRLGDDQIERLRDLAVAVVALFDRRRQARRSAELAVEAETQRAQSSLAARELEARTELSRAVLETVDVAIVAAGPDGRLSMFNRAAADWYGLPAGATLLPDERPSHYRLLEADGCTPLSEDRIPLRRALDDGEVSGAEMVIATPGRPTRHVVCSGRSIARADGSPLGAVVAMHDVTTDRAQRGELEAAHRQLSERGRELERSNAELAEFAAVAAHDLRSPLGAIDGYLALLLDVYGDDLPSRGRDWVAVARTAVARMLRLTESLLDYARAGAADCHRERVDVAEIVGSVALDLHRELRRAAATVCSRQPLPAVEADPVLLRQLIQNLVANAIAHRDPERECHVEVSVEECADGWVVAVADSGRGVPPEQRDRVFGMFARLDGASGGGSGIGLATCARIAEQHDGRIWIDETPGGGATVRLHLPRQADRRAPVGSEARTAKSVA